jgi:hypothetical protein
MTPIVGFIEYDVGHASCARSNAAVLNCGGRARRPPMPHHAAMLSRRSDGTNLYADRDLRWRPPSNIRLRPTREIPGKRSVVGLATQPGCARSESPCDGNFSYQKRSIRLCAQSRTRINFAFSPAFGVCFDDRGVSGTGREVTRDVSTLEVLTAGVLNLWTVLPEMSCTQVSRRRLCIPRPFSKQRFSGEYRANYRCSRSPHRCYSATRGSRNAVASYQYAAAHAKQAHIN